MKKHKGLLAVGMIAMSLMLGGCGIPMYELTAEEQDIIVQYAAHFVAKHNIYQKDGMTSVQGTEEEAEDTEDTQLPDGTEDDKKPDVPKGISFARAIGMKDKLSVTYTGSTVEASVKQGNVYEVNPHKAGNVLYVMKFEVENISDKDVELSNLLSTREYKLTNEQMTNHRQTFLDNDFSSYVGTLTPGQTVEMILIFEAKPADADAIKEPKLQIIENNVKNDIEL